MTKFKIKLEIPSIQLFMELRQHTDWGVPDVAACQAALDNSLCGATAYDHVDPIGMARIIGDGALNLYIQDVIIHRDYREQGIGKALLARLIQYLTKTYPASATIGLMAADNQAGFYESFGFSSWPSVGFGPGMTASLESLAKTEAQA